MIVIRPERGRQDVLETFLNPQYPTILMRCERCQNNSHASHRQVLETGRKIPVTAIKTSTPRAP